MMQVANKRPSSITLIKAIEDKTSARTETTTGSDEEEYSATKRVEEELVAVVEPARITINISEGGQGGGGGGQGGESDRRGSVKRFE
jgi:hypothetical protein